MLKRPTRYVAIDTESDGLKTYLGHRVFAAAAAFPNGETMFWRDEFGGLRRILEDESIDKVFHNYKHEIHMAKAMGWKIRGMCWDTQCLGHLIDGRDAGKGLALGRMAIKYLPESQRKVVGELDQWFDDEGYGKKERYTKFGLLPPELLKKRCVGDTQLTLGLFQRLFPTVFNTFPFLLEQEHRLIPVVQRMEERGITIDYDAIEEQQKEFTEVIEAVIRFCEGVIGCDDFNLDSHSDQEELLERAGLLSQIKQFTKGRLDKATGLRVGRKPKLDDFNLRQLHHPVSHMLLLGKACTKMRDTFLQQMLDRAVNGVLHPNFNQFGTTTGRFSCSDPNLQNIPIDGNRRTSYTEDEAEEAFEMTGFEYAPHIKRIFLCRPGFAHIHSDKKQAEMYMLGHYAQDRTMFELFNRGGNIHEQICQELYHEITKGLKTRTKAVVFGFQYGAGLETLAKKIGGTIADAQAAKSRLAAVLPGIPRLKRELDQTIRKQGYVQTIHGRRHYVDLDKTYICINRMCQGSVGDEIKSCMVAMDDWARSEGNGVQLLLNIHDDLGSELPIEEVPKAAPEIKRIMETPSMPYRLPLPSSLDVTYTRWADLVEINDLNNIPGPKAPAVSKNKKHQPA